MILIDNSLRKKDTIGLSYREIQVIDLIVKEFNNEEIAVELRISKRTVESHRKNIFRKTKVKSLIGLVLLAIRNNLVQI